MRKRQEFAVFDVMAEDYPQDIDAVDAYLITGSQFSVYEDLPWIERLLSFIRALNERQKKLVGICFGHQAIAQALGGRTEKARAGGGVGHLLVILPEGFKGFSGRYQTEGSFDCISIVNQLSSLIILPKEMLFVSGDIFSQVSVIKCAS